MGQDFDEMGTIDYYILEFPGARITGLGLPAMVDLVDRGIIRIHDLQFIRKEQDGSLTRLRVADLDPEGELDLAPSESAFSGLLDQDEIDEACSVIETGSCAGVFVIEHLWAGPLGAALRRGGVRLVSSGRVEVQDVIARLDAAEDGGSIGFWHG